MIVRIDLGLSTCGACYGVRTDERELALRLWLIQQAGYRRCNSPTHYAPAVGARRLELL